MQKSYFDLGTFGLYESTAFMRIDSKNVYTDNHSFPVPQIPLTFLQCCILMKKHLGLVVIIYAIFSRNSHTNVYLNYI